MSFIPLGFAFAARNKGLEGEFKKTRKNMDGLNGALGQTNRSATGAAAAFGAMATAAKITSKAIQLPFKAMGGMIDAVERRVGQFNLASIADDVKKLTGESGNLSTQMDSAFASNAKAIKPLLAGIGKSGKELRRLTSQASSMAYSMDVSAESVGKVMVELESAGGPAKAGLDALNMSTKDFVKLVEVGGPETAQLGSFLGDLQTSWSMTATQAAETANAVMAYGQAAGVGAEGIKKIDGLMEKFNAVLADAPPNMQVTADQMQGMIIGATKLAGAYREMGASQEQALDYSQQTAELFTKEAVAFQKAAEGRGEYGDMAKGLMPVLKEWGSWDEFGAALKVGALDATKGMVKLNEIVQSASAKGFGPADVLMRQLLGTIGETSPSMAWLAQNTNAGAAALSKFDAMTVKSDGSLQKFAKDGFSTGFTLQESFDRAKQGMEQMVRSIASREVSGMVRTQIGAYRDMGKQIVRMGNDKTWGPILKKAVILKRMGLRGLLMSATDSKSQQKSMAKTFAGLEMAAGAIEDVTGAMSPLMSTMGKFGPLGTLAGGIATWFTIPKSAREKLIKDFQPVWAKVKEGLWSAWGSLKEWWAGFKPTLLKWGGDLWTAVKTTAKTYGPGIASALWEGIKGIGGLLMGGLKEAFSDPKIGLAASMLVAIKAGGIFGAKGVLATAAVESWVLAYQRSEAALKEMKDQRDAEANMQRRNREKLSGNLAERFVEGSRPEDWEAELGISQEESALMVPGLTQSTDYAKRFATDTATQLALVEKGRVGLREKLGGGVVGELQESALAAAQRGNVKFRTGQGGDSSFAESALSGVFNMAGVGRQVNQQMEGHEAAIGKVQKTGMGQKLLGEVAWDPSLFAGRIEVLPAMMQQVSRSMQENAKAMGLGIMSETARGLSEGQQGTVDQIIATQNQWLEYTRFQSPPKQGPLSASAGNPLYNSGIGMMRLVSDGIKIGAQDVQNAMLEAIVGSFRLAMGEYEKEAEAALTSSQVMAKVADQLVQNLTGVGRIDMGDVKISTEEQRVLRASLDIPGLAGVTGAIIADGNLTRQILTRIADATEGTYKLASGEAKNTRGSTGLVLAAV
jgi:hypothetical protein